MSSPSDLGAVAHAGGPRTTARLRAAGVALIAAVSAAALPVMDDARAGVQAQTAPDAFTPQLPAAASAPASAPAATGERYLLRCWQHGRLLFEERDVVLPPAVVAGELRLRGRDAQGAPVYLADTRSALCLVRASRPQPRPR